MTPDGNNQFNGEPADYFSLNPMPVIILSSNAFIQYRNEAAVKWIDSKPEATREANLRNIRQMAASGLESGASGEVQIGPPKDFTCLIVVPEKHSGTVCFQAMPASSQDVRAKTTSVASTGSAEHFHDEFRSLIENSLQGIPIHRDWQPIFANDALARIFGYPEANAILELDNIRELYAGHERDRLKMSIRRGWPVARSRRSMNLKRFERTAHLSRLRRQSGSSIGMENGRRNTGS